MSGRTQLRKATDYETKFWCAGGAGILREEVWVDDNNRVVRFNLAFVLTYVSQDNGRILGYDNAHSPCERHYLGTATSIPYVDYPEVAQRFYLEAEALRRSYEDKGIS